MENPILTGKEIEFDTVRQPVPQWFYSRQILRNNQSGLYIGENWNIEIEYGRAFLLENIYCIFKNKNGNGLNVSISDATNSRQFFLEGSRSNLLATPGGSNENVQPVPNPYTDDLTGIVYDSEFYSRMPVNSSKHIGYMEPYRGNVSINFKLPNETQLADEKITVDFVLFGYLVVQKNLEMWR